MRTWAKNVNESIESYQNTPYERYKSYERFRFVKDIMEERISGTEDFLDIGCAKGEFIWYLKDFFPAMHFTGVDIAGTLLSLARKETKLGDVAFVKADARPFKLAKKFGVVSLSIILSILMILSSPYGRW